MRATHRPIGILFQLQLPELELQRVEQDQASDERLARPEDELDRLHRLDRADDAGEDAEHAAFSARGHESRRGRLRVEDRKSTRLNSSHLVISYAVFCLKKKKIIKTSLHRP